MIALDTNILLRFVLDDNAVLSPVARRIVERNECWVSLLAAGELGYVLTSVYRSNSAEVISYCRILMDLPTIAVEHERRFAQALDGVEAGIDWFDAMLWASAPAGSIVFTFDRAFSKRASAIGWDVQVRLPKAGA